MRVHNLDVHAIDEMIQVDLATLTSEPGSEIDSFEFHGCNVGVAAFRGRPPWERHPGGDELLFILDGASRLTVLEEAGETTQDLAVGTLVVVPQGRWHSNDASSGVTMLWITPAEGNEHSWASPRS